MGYIWPEWFKEKYSHYLNFDSCLSSKHEAKTYTEPLNELIDDVSKVMDERASNFDTEFILVWLHEDGAITQVILRHTPDNVKRVFIFDPTGWQIANTRIVGESTYESICPNTRIIHRFIG